MQRGDERADLAVARLVMSQQLQLVAAVKGQQTVTGQAAGAQGVEFMQGENALDKFSRSSGSCSRPSSSTGSHG